LRAANGSACRRPEHAASHGGAIAIPRHWPDRNGKRAEASAISDTVVRIQSPAHGDSPVASRPLAGDLAPELHPLGAIAAAALAFTSSAASLRACSEGSSFKKLH
jgi:hypothetical protein